MVCIYCNQLFLQFNSVHLILPTRQHILLLLLLLLLLLIIIIIIIIIISHHLYVLYLQLYTRNKPCV